MVRRPREPHPVNARTRAPDRIRARIGTHRTANRIRGFPAARRPAVRRTRPRGPGRQCRPSSGPRRRRSRKPRCRHRETVRNPHPRAARRGPVPGTHSVPALCPRRRPDARRTGCPHLVPGPTVAFPRRDPLPSRSPRSGCGRCSRRPRPVGPRPGRAHPTGLPCPHQGAHRSPRRGCRRTGPGRNSRRHRAGHRIHRRHRTGRRRPPSRSGR